MANTSGRGSGRTTRASRGRTSSNRLWEDGSRTKYTQSPIGSSQRGMRPNVQSIMAAMQAFPRPDRLSGYSQAAALRAAARGEVARNSGLNNPMYFQPQFGQSSKSYQDMVYDVMREGITRPESFYQYLDEASAETYSQRNRNRRGARGSGSSTARQRRKGKGGGGKKKPAIDMGNNL